MANLKSKSFYRTVLARSAALAALALGLTSMPVQAQDTIGGTFTLNENARFGNSVLARGQYKFSIEPVGVIQSVHSIQNGIGHMVLVVLKPEQAGPVAAVFAMASPRAHGSEGDELILGSEKAGPMAETMYLEKSGLKIDFRWSSPKTKGQQAAERPVPVQSAAAQRPAGK
jgi:hypothetical protein